MRSLVIAACVAALALPILGTPAAQATVAPLAAATSIPAAAPAMPAGDVTGAKAGKTSILYSIDGRRVKLSRDGATWRLSMPAATSVTWFTDRPHRRAGSTTLSSLAAIWEASGFTDDPPNAALIMQDGGKERTHVVEMTDPRVGHNRVSFAVKAIEGGTEAGYKHTHNLRASSYERARLFIDDAALEPCPGVLTSDQTIATAESHLKANPPWAYQCLLAPGSTMSVQDQNPADGTIDLAPTLVMTCAADSKDTGSLGDLTRYGYPASGPVLPTLYSCAHPNANAGMGGSIGFKNPQDKTFCPNPTNQWGVIKFTSPKSLGYTVQVTVTWGQNVTCPWIRSTL